MGQKITIQVEVVYVSFNYETKKEKVFETFTGRQINKDGTERLYVTDNGIYTPVSLRYRLPNGVLMNPMPRVDKPRR